MVEIKGLFFFLASFFEVQQKINENLYIYETHFE